ncbi:MAG: Dyp-type peroxidase [Acidimicrobiales bacterium]
MTESSNNQTGAPSPDGGGRERTAFSRRGFLGAMGGLAGGAAIVGTGVELAPGGARSSHAAEPSAIEPFYGTHQGGIATQPQSHSYFAALDVTTERRAEVADLLRSWTDVAGNLTTGKPAGSVTGYGGVREADSGEALGLGPARLTLNFGFGPSLFESGGEDRFGIARERPIWLVDLPEFPGDQLTEFVTGGDLTVHACADDPQVAFHAVRQLAGAAEGLASIRWSQAGFNEAMAVGGTPRNLMGFKDGTVNVTTDSQLNEFVWVGDEGPRWLTGGTYLVARRIRMSLERWDAESLESQERVIGRHKVSGAPLGMTNESDELDLDAKNADGSPVIPADAHVRVASPQENWGQTLLRRSYSYTGGTEVTGDDATSPLPRALDAGLFFCVYQRNPRLAFIPIFRRLAQIDALSRFTTHTASAIAAIPRAPSGRGAWIGQELFGA